ncbi:(Fe-S)-binding protein [Nevskia soli]|uniref:(Fe-S)-binding protein n=1 Tax=Nevskia soli TaxID=418856 RepID=UPI0015D95395|nr:(Fe-S)-binding protein [Nevskia soli]
MGRPSLLEVLILAVAICISLGLFWARFRRFYGNFEKAKPDPDYSIHPIWPRVRDFVWEVLCQGLVIKERPLPGLAHAFVFWGFLAFGLITMNHVAEGFGFDAVSRDSWFGTAYFGFVYFFAAVVAVSIAGLFVRRFFVRPRWLGAKVSYESGFIAFLIFLLMVTYMAGFHITPGTALGKANWWLHTISLLVFLPLIPHTKHLHLVLSPFAIFAKRPGFSDIPKLSGDEDFGLDTGKDVTKLDVLQAFSCVECGRCTEHCPAFNTGKELNPKEIILGLRRYLNDPAAGIGSEQPLLGTHISEKAAFQCTTCGGCEYQCPVGIQHLPVIIGLRRGAVNTGKWEDEHGTKLFLNMERNGNSLGFASSERQKFIERAELPIYDGSQEYLLWLGCMGAYDPQGRDTIQALAKVLRYAGVSFGVLRKERCNGDPARRLGNDLLFTQLAEQNIETLQSAAPKKMVSICPHCVRTISTDWKEAGTTFEIEHHSELLARIQDRLPQQDDREREQVVYHDPCYLGRYRDVYDEPRAIINRYAEVVEAPRHRERSFCCGAGGGQMFLGEEEGRRVNVTRAEELVKTGAKTIGAACPFCQTMFRDALAQIETGDGERVKLLDIAQIAAASIPEG